MLHRRLKWVFSVMAGPREGPQAAAMPTWHSTRFQMETEVVCAEGRGLVSRVGGWVSEAVCSPMGSLYELSEDEGRQWI